VEYFDAETSSRIILDDGTVLDRCYHCREGWKGRNERGERGAPQCEGCKVALFAENEDAAAVYMITRRQVITRSRGMDGDVVIDISVPAVKAAMDAFKITDQGECLKKVQRTFHHFLAERER
jgi:hypothetical protein